ncbi:HIT family protein [bacterium]|nr:HIT family protein [bacterium]
MEDCIFCKIIKGEIPSYKVAETAEAYAFLDIGPLSAGHTLVLPKKHIKNIFEADPKDLYPVLDLVQKIAALMKEKLPCDGVNILINNGEAAGQSVHHCHWHIIPRFAGDGYKFPPAGSLSKEQAEEILGKLK